MRTLALVSTPLHLFHSWALTGSSLEEQRECTVCFINQVPGRPNRYLETLQRWEACPFGELVRLDTQCERRLDRVALRKAAFRRLDEIIEGQKPERILVGNDRLIEFLYAHHSATKRLGQVQTVYVDDGVYSYLPSPAPPLPVERVVKGFHKLSYGSWYDRPSHVGSSSKIDLGVLELPEFAHRHLRTKPIEQARSNALSSDPVREFCGLLAESFGVQREAVRRLDALVLLPRARYDQQIKNGLGTRYRSLVHELREQGLHVGFKHHPREESPDPLGLGKVLEDMQVLPPGICFEALVPLLRDPVVVGDVSSVLLTAKWISPQLRVYSLLDPKSSRQAALRPLFEHLQIPVLDTHELSLQVSEARHLVPH